MKSKVVGEIFPRGTPPVEELFADVDGARMRYLRAGTGPPLILLHGLMGYSFSWRFTIPALARYATVYAVDSVGTGFSDRPAGLNCSLRSGADRLLSFLDAVGVRSFDLLGTSYGGAVAMFESMVDRALSRSSPEPTASASQELKVGESLTRHSNFSYPPLPRRVVSKT